MKEKGSRPQADHTSLQTGFEAHESVEGVWAWLGVKGSTGVPGPVCCRVGSGVSSYRTQSL